MRWPERWLERWPGNWLAGWLTLRTSPLRVDSDLGPMVPGWAVRVAFAVVASALCLDRYPLAVWILLGLPLTAIAVAWPQRPTGWAVVTLLGGSQVLLDQSPPGWRFFVLLAGLHLLHELATQSLVLPWRSRVQLAVFRRPLLRFLALQAVVQAVAWVALVVLIPDSGARLTVPALGVIGAAALVGVTLLLVVPQLRERAR